MITNANVHKSMETMKKYDQCFFVDQRISFEQYISINQRYFNRVKTNLQKAHSYSAAKKNIIEKSIEAILNIDFASIQTELDRQEATIIIKENRDVIYSELWQDQDYTKDVHRRSSTLL